MSKKRVLLVDDARSIRTVFSQIIQSIGHEVTCTENAIEGLKHIVEVGKPDLIITDMNMPGMNGIEFARRIRQVLKGTPILMMSTESDKRLIQEAREAGVTGWMLKPIEHNALVNKLNKFLEESSVASSS
ncbi:MAG: response regulator [Limnobacter sp.]|nr:response regulator [Limnobacter sp.]